MREILYAILVVSYKRSDITISFVKNELSKILSDSIIVICNNEAVEDSDEILTTNLDAQLFEVDPDPDHNYYINYTKKVFILSNPENSGFAGGNNLAAHFVIKYFQVKYLLFSNNDIVISSDCIIEKLIKKLESNSSIGIIGPRIVGLCGEFQSPEPYESIWRRYFFRYYSSLLFLSTKQKRRFFQLDYSEKAKEGFHYRIMGSFFMMRLIDFLECGMMDPHTFLYAEESILSERLKTIGKGVYYYPEVSVLHEHSATASTYLSNRKRCMLQFESDAYYYKKYKAVNRITIFFVRLLYKAYLQVKYRENGNKK